MTLHAIACAKVNLSLRVGSRQEDGLHRIAGIFQSISWVDRLALEPAPEDQLSNSRGTEVIAGWDNLAWRAVRSVRDAAGAAGKMHLLLDKTIPAAAGLGGGSADAAAGLALSGRLHGVEKAQLLELAVPLGSDVPFCFTGGTAEVSGTGAELRALEPAAGFSLVLVVPPIELSTAAVYAAWDRLDGPSGPAVSGGDVPPPLREHGPLINDLLPAALAVAPELDDWRANLEAHWGRPVMLTGSGPTLFAFFIDAEEAAAAITNTPVGARAEAVADPVPVGWAIGEPGATVTASGPLSDADAERLGRLLAPT